VSAYSQSWLGNTLSQTAVVYGLGETTVHHVVLRVRRRRLPGLPL